MSETRDDRAARGEPRPEATPGALPDDVLSDEEWARSVLTPPAGARAEADAEALVRMRADLAAAAEQADLLDVAYRTLDTPVGELLLAATSRGLVRVAFADHDAVLAELAARVSPRVLRAADRLEPVVRQLEEYFAGTRTAFELPLDLRLARGFRLAVVERLPHVTYGSTTTYTALAGLAGSPAAVRAVGTACARNPLPVVVPCHRVLRSDGGLGGYIGGLAAKRALLELEGVHPAA